MSTSALKTRTFDSDAAARGASSDDHQGATDQAEGVRESARRDRAAVSLRERECDPEQAIGPGDGGQTVPLEPPPVALLQDEQSEIHHLRGVVDRLRYTATHDPLTGLPTREVLLDRLQRELTRNAAGADRVAILFVDLDNFKRVNDSLGHSSGDEVLREMARRIVGCIGTQDTASRFGGDELVILHPCAQASSEAALGTRILATTAKPIFISGKEVVVSASRCARTRFTASLQRFGRLARRHAEASASLARYAWRPPLRPNSRLMVEGARRKHAAIERIEQPATTPREISSRSDSDSTRFERTLGAGRMPPL